MLTENKDTLVPTPMVTTEIVSVPETKKPESVLRTIGFGALAVTSAIALGLLGEFIHQKTGVDPIWFMRGKN